MARMSAPALALPLLSQLCFVANVGVQLSSSVAAAQVLRIRQPHTPATDELTMVVHR